MHSARSRASLTEDSSGDPFFLPAGTPKDETLCQFGERLCGESVRFLQLVRRSFERAFIAEPTREQRYAVQQDLRYMCYTMSNFLGLKRFVYSYFEVKVYDVWVCRP